MSSDKNKITPEESSVDAVSAQKIIDEAIKKKGLKSTTIRKAIDSIEYGILRTIHRKFDKPIEKPVELLRPLPPQEPVMPLVPQQPNLPTYLDYLSEEERKGELYSYRRAKKSYELQNSEYPKKMEEYYKNKSEYEGLLLDYKVKIAEYEYQYNIYKFELSRYEDYLERVKLNKKIEDLYFKKTGLPWLNDPYKTTYYILMGMPGHGKTTAFREASKKIAKELGMKFLENPSIGMVVDVNTFVFSVVDLAGEVSKMNVSGLPAKETDGKNTYMTSLPPYRIATLQNAGGAVLLLDDLTNASEFIQNIALPLTNEGMFNEVNVKNVYVGATCNLGALDATNTSSMSSALRNRMKPLYVQDNLNDFIARVSETFNDGLGDAYISSFFELYPHLFVPTLPKKDQMGGYTTPRSSTNFIVECRKHIYDHSNEDSGKLSKACLEKIKTDAQSMLGLDVGREYVSFLDTVMSDADPIAKSLILEGKYNKEKFNKYYGDGFSIESKTFTHKLKSALVKYAVFAVRSKIKIDVVLENFVQACMIMKKLDDLSTLVDYFNSHFSVAVKEYSIESGTTSTRYTLSPEIQNKLVEFFIEHPDYDNRSTIRNEHGKEENEVFIVISNSLSNVQNYSKKLSNRVRKA